MPTKRIIVLANSIKKSARCVAGIEVGAGDQLAPAGWLRPVSGESEGELEPRHMRVEDRDCIKIYDIVDVPLSEYSNDPIHPEDWVVDAETKWKAAGEFDASRLHSLEEKINDLWLEPGVGSDRVTNTFVLQRPDHQSLYLIRPVNFRVELSVTQYPNNQNPSRRRRGRFSYRGQDYEMNLTDPVFMETHCGSMPAVGAPTKTIKPPYGDNCLLCVSITPLFREYHWKVVATVLELP